MMIMQISLKSGKSESGGVMHIYTVQQLYTSASADILAIFFAISYLIFSFFSSLDVFIWSRLVEIMSVLGK